MINCAAKEAAYNQAAAFGNIFLDDPSGRKVIAAEYVDGCAVNGTIPDWLHRSAGDAAGSIDTGNIVLPGQCHIVDHAHVIPDYAADSHRVGILAANVHVPDRQVFDFSQAHADYSDAADRIIRMEKDI